MEMYLDPDQYKLNLKKTRGQHICLVEGRGKERMDV